MPEKRRAAKALILVGTLPPPITGQSLAFKSAIQWIMDSGVMTRVVDVSDHSHGRRLGAFSLSRAIKILRAFFTYVTKLPGSDMTYLCITQSSLGFLRDSAFIWFARLFGDRVAVHFHGGGLCDFVQSRNWAMKVLMRVTYSQVDKAIVLGNSFRDEFSFLQPDQVEIEVVPNTLPAGIRVASRARVLSEGEPLVILFMSNLIESKGYWDLLDAVEQLLNDGRQVKAIFCGEFIQSPDADGYETTVHAEAAFRRQIELGELALAVEYRGVVLGEQKQQAFDEANLLVLPTYYEKEGQPIAIIEALASALPVISTSYRGIPDMIVDGESGFLVEPRSPNEIAEKVAALQDAPSIYHRLSAHALERFHECFEPEIVKQRFLEALFG